MSSLRRFRDSKQRKTQAQRSHFCRRYAKKKTKNEHRDTLGWINDWIFVENRDKTILLMQDCLVSNLDLDTTVMSPNATNFSWFFRRLEDAYVDEDAVTFGRPSDGNVGYGQGTSSRLLDCHIG